MRRSGLLATVVLSGCLASQTRVGMNAAGNRNEPRQVELVEGKAVDLGSGVTVTLESVMYTHATDKTGRSVNDSFMQLEVAHEGKTENVTITRLFPDAPHFTTVAGLELAIDYVDAYHSPLTGAVLVR